MGLARGGNEDRRAINRSLAQEKDCYCGGCGIESGAEPLEPH